MLWCYSVRLPLVHAGDASSTIEDLGDEETGSMDMSTFAPPAPMGKPYFPQQPKPSGPRLTPLPASNSMPVYNNGSRPHSPREVSLQMGPYANS